MSEKIGIYEKTKIFLGEVRTEMSKVVWPTREQVKSYTITVLVASVVIASLIGLWDVVLGWGIDQLFNLTG